MPDKLPIDFNFVPGIVRGVIENGISAWDQVNDRAEAWDDASISDYRLTPLRLGTTPTYVFTMPANLPTGGWRIRVYDVESPTAGDIPIAVIPFSWDGTDVNGDVSIDSSTVQAACAAALDAYDPPTHAELTAAVSGIGGGGATANEVRDAILAATVDGSVSLETLLRVSLAFMAGKANVTDDGGQTYTVTYLRDDETTEVLRLVASKATGSRAAKGTITS